MLQRHTHIAGFLWIKRLTMAISQAVQQINDATSCSLCPGPNMAPTLPIMQLSLSDCTSSPAEMNSRQKKIATISF